MGRKFTEPKLLIASHNAGKVKEITELLAGRDIEIVTAAELGIDEPEETGETFMANARLKAEAAVAATALPCLADDSGLAVEALHGAPGIYSARWAGPGRDFRLAMEKVNAALDEAGAESPDQRRAAFVALTVLAWPDGHIEFFEGRVEGVLVWPPRGDNGFGYDPMFMPDGHSRTFGQMSPEEKHGTGAGSGLSHRSRALALMADACFFDR
ncbi:MAG: RdgB/HAM1 family non-canonical purine NTP pyrophosphatase [Hyphomicrobiales bacterium]